MYRETKRLYLFCFKSDRTKSFESNNCGFADMVGSRLIFVLLVAAVAIVVAHKAGNLTKSKFGV